MSGESSDIELDRHVAPADWVNPTPSGRYHLVVIGGGPAGLVAAAGAAGLGAKVALIERHRGMFRLHWLGMFWVFQTKNY